MVDDKFGAVVGEDGKDREESLPLYFCSSRRRRLVKSGNILASGLETTAEGNVRLNGEMTSTDFG
jgi:hypothetical protein